MDNHLEPSLPPLFGPGELDRDSPLPLHAQIRRRLMAAVAGWPAAETRFPPEEALSRYFGVSRMTMRKAIDGLVVGGHLRRHRGAGTFVAFRKVEERFTPAMDFLDQWANHGRAIAMRVLRFGTRPALEAEALALGLDTGTPCLVVERLRLAGTVPVSLDLRVIPPAFAAGVTRRAAATGSLLDALRGMATVTRATMQIEAKAAQGRVASQLEVLPGDPVLFRRLLYRDADGVRVMAGHSFYRADQARYVVELPIAPTPPPPRKTAT